MPSADAHRRAQSARHAPRHCCGGPPGERDADGQRVKGPVNNWQPCLVSKSPILQSGGVEQVMTLYMPGRTVRTGMCWDMGEHEGLVVGMCMLQRTLLADVVVLSLLAAPLSAAGRQLTVPAQRRCHAQRLCSWWWPHRQLTQPLVTNILGVCVVCLSNVMSYRCSRCPEGHNP